MMRYFYSAISLLVFTFALSSYPLLAQSSQKSPPTFLKVNQKAKDFQIKEFEENWFAFELEKGQGYSLVVEQKGIDLILRLTDTEGNLIKEQDSPNGNTGPEEIFFAPENKKRFYLSVKPLKEPKNPPVRQYSIRLTQLSDKPATYRLESLEQDFDLLISSLKEAHAGLNWYSAYKDFIGNFMGLALAQVILNAKGFVCRYAAPNNSFNGERGIAFLSSRTCP
jgi:hypothetical protein